MDPQQILQFAQAAAPAAGVIRYLQDGALAKGVAA